MKHLLTWIDTQKLIQILRNLAITNEILLCEKKIIACLVSHNRKQWRLDIQKIQFIVCLFVVSVDKTSIILTCLLSGVIRMYRILYFQFLFNGHRAIIEIHKIRIINIKQSDKAFSDSIQWAFIDHCLKWRNRVDQVNLFKMSIRFWNVQFVTEN